MAEVEALPPLLPGGGLPPAAGAGLAASHGLHRLQRHTASSRLHALVDPESDRAAEIRALLRRDSSSDGAGGGAGGRLPALGASGASDYVRRGVENLRDLVARKRQVNAANCCCRLQACRVPGPHPAASAARAAKGRCAGSPHLTPRCRPAAGRHRSSWPR